MTLKRNHICSFLIILSVLTLSGCKFYGAPDVLKPGRAILAMEPKNAPENYRKGWRDGCETGLASMTNSFYRSFYKFKMDKDLRNDATYYRVWKDMVTFCRHYAYGIIRQGDDRMRLPEHLPSYWERFAGTHPPLEYGLGSLLGPATQGMLLEKYGKTEGTGFFEQGGVTDFSADEVWNGRVDGWGTGGVLDFAPAQQIVPY